ncbi:MAG: RcpC/CpaB family pilus assembly protein [Specibacter sp.]
MAALLLCAAAALAVAQMTPSGPETTTVLVAARDLPAGHTLAAADLAPLAVSPAMVPDGILPASGTEAVAGSAPGGVDGASPHKGTGAGMWIGRQVSGPVRRGEVMTDAALVGEELLIGAPPGSQAVPLRLADPTTVQLLRQGQLVNVVLSSSKGLDGPSSNEVLARNVPVLWTPVLSGSGGGLLPSQETQGLVVVAATAEQAVPLAGASARGKLFLILVN